MESFVFKNITFNKNEIIIDRKKEKIRISIDNIKNMQYTRKIFFELFTYLWIKCFTWLASNKFCQSHW